MTDLSGYYRKIFSCVAETALGHFAETELTKSEKSGQRSRTAGITV
jgi:hypothetical protein